MADNTEVRNILLARSTTAASLAATLLSIADAEPHEGEDAPYDATMNFGHIRSLVDRLEAQTCALLQYAGLSWDAIGNAGDKQTSRQAMHRRMAFPAEMERLLAQEASRDNARRLKENIENAYATARYLRESSIRDIDKAANTWAERRHTLRWWTWW